MQGRMARDQQRQNHLGDAAQNDDQVQPVPPHHLNGESCRHGNMLKPDLIDPERWPTHKTIQSLNMSKS